MFEEMMVGVGAVIAASVLIGVTTYVKASPIFLILAIILFGFGLWMLYRQAT